MYLSIFMVLIFLAVSGAVSMIYSDKLVEQTGKITEQNMRIITKEIDEKINAVLGICDSVRDNEVLQQLMGLENPSEEHAYEQRHGISKILRQRGYSNIAVNSIFAVGLDKQVYDPLYQISPYHEIISQYEALDDFIQSGEYNAFSAPTTFPNNLVDNEQEDKPYITYFSQYLSDIDFKLLGYILINVKKEHLFRGLKEIDKQVFDFIYIVDKSGNLIYKIGEELAFTGDIIQHNQIQQINPREIQTIKGEDYYINRQSLSSYPDWIVVGGMNYEKVKKDSVVILEVVFVIGLIGIFIVVAISFYLSKKVTDPIVEINNAMAQFEQRKWPDRLQPKTEDELKSLINSFNNMVVQFRVLLDQVHQEHEEKKKAEVEALELKLELLQAQINPHFVHNTLNAMQYLALKRGAHDIRGLIQSFNMLLRTSMSLGKDFISIKEELNCVTSYMNIQRYRYDYDIKVKFEVEEELQEVQIPKLILQPIVENALYHGIIPKDQGGTILIKICESEDRIVISVKDDGVGIREEKLNRLSGEKAVKSNSGFNNIGLNNIKARLRLNYGEDYSLKVESKPGEGTLVWFNVPKYKGPKEDSHGEAKGNGGGRRKAGEGDAVLFD